MGSKSVQRRINQLVQSINYHNKKYYLNDNPEISDPEFDLWKWVDFWQPIDEIISFKREVYKQALKQLEPFIV
mgnify:CR=1 FL=1